MITLRHLSWLQATWPEMAPRLATRLRRDPELRRLGHRFDQELELLAGELLGRITWQTMDPSGSARRFETFGRDAFERGFELHSLVRGLQLARASAMEWLQQERPSLDGAAPTEAQWLDLVTQATDFAVLHVVSGFEHARAAETALFALTGNLPRRRPTAA